MGSDDEEFDEFLDKSTNNYPIEQFNTDLLKKDVKNDLAKLEEIFELLKKISPEKDPKLIILLKELKKIIKDAKDESISREDEINKRKVIIFSFYADTVKWINNFLLEAIKTDDTFSVYKDRIEIILAVKLAYRWIKPL